MNNSTARTDLPVPDDHDALKPSERFAHVLKTVLRVTPAELAAQEARSKAENGTKPRGPAKGTPNWRVKRRQAMEQPTQ